MLNAALRILFVLNISRLLCHSSLQIQTEAVKFIASAGQNQGNDVILDLNPLFYHVQSCRVEIILPDLFVSPVNQLIFESILHHPLVVTAGTRLPKLKNRFGHYHIENDTSTQIRRKYDPFSFPQNCRVNFVLMPTINYKTYFEAVSNHLHHLHDSLNIWERWSSPITGTAEEFLESVWYRQYLYSFYLFSSQAEWTRRADPEEFQPELLYLKFTKIFFLNLATGKLVGHICQYKNLRYSREYSTEVDLETFTLEKLHQLYRKHFISGCGGLNFVFYNAQEKTCLTHVPLPRRTTFLRFRNRQLMTHEVPN